jgi:thiol-disulfide isomerase/thioredoxin
MSDDGPASNGDGRANNGDGPANNGNVPTSDQTGPTSDADGGRATRRRELLAGLGGLGVVGAGALVATGRVSLSGEDGTESDGVEPIRIEALAVPGCDCASLSVPERGAPTYLEFFATWCDVCEGMMPVLGEAYESVDWDVQFVSVTYEAVGQTTTREDVREWWNDHDGTWALGLDADLDLVGALDVTGVPTSVVLDADNVVTWRHEGRASAEDILVAIDDAREAR